MMSFTTITPMIENVKDEQSNCSTPHSLYRSRGRARPQVDITGFALTRLMIAKTQLICLVKAGSADCRDQTQRHERRKRAPRKSTAFRPLEKNCSSAARLPT